MLVGLLVALFFTRSSICLQITDLEPLAISSGSIQNNQWLYYRVRALLDTTSSIKVSTSTCRGIVNLYVKYCNPVQSTSGCEDEYQYIPNAENSDFTEITTTTTGETTIDKICLSDDGTCSGTMYYYIGLNAITNNTEVQILLEVYPVGSSPVQYEMSQMIAVDIDTGDINWQPASYCTQQDVQSDCQQTSPVPGAQYQIYFSDSSN